MIAAVIAIPQLIAEMGMARFGVLSLAWIVVGYFSLFDFGLGRAMTQLVSRKIGSGRTLISDIAAAIGVVPSAADFDGFVEEETQLSESFERNRYSLPASFANRPVAIKVYAHKLVIFGPCIKPKASCRVRLPLFSTATYARAPQP